MLRYRLDDLGAYQFEKLAQSALKASIGLGVESWGNRGDWGRDSYAACSLRFPDTDVQTKGPFIFQVKFVEGANAAGAKPKAALLSSASKEAKRILERIATRGWKSPSHLLFVTNSLVAADSREKVRSTFKGVMPGSEIHIWGGDDVCDILDRFSSIPRAFPQLLSIRDLDELITRALTKESRERSETALQIAQELVPVFAPTSSCERAWAVLRKHNFAVLEGPPEVGKSAIAWMIGLTQAAQGWEAVVCNTPAVFFEMLKGRNTPQVFIADDAFGRTEYDPTRTSKWEADLDMILHRLDRRHWLIWTSRKHILERACDRMDAQGKARSFPDPGSVLVDVSELSVEERALILFRHARAARLPDKAKALVRAHASEIIYDPEFTPERIRRFIHESLPRITLEVQPDAVRDTQVRQVIKEALRNPTKQMRITFQKLPAAYKWFLVALLEIPAYTGGIHVDLDRLGTVENLQPLYEAYCPERDQEPFKIVMDHLTEAFVKIRTILWRIPIVDWIHPSYRDLVIEELIQDASLRHAFLRRASLEGVKLAVSDTGGRQGDRKMPLIRSAESWDILEERCLSLITGAAEDREVLEVLANAASESASSDQQERWGRVLKFVCDAVRTKWDQTSRLIPAIDLEAFARARRYARPMPALPNFRQTWGRLDGLFRESLRLVEGSARHSYEAFENLAAFARVASECNPVFLAGNGFPGKYEAEIAEVLLNAKSEADDDPDENDPEELRDLAGRADSIATSVDVLASLSSEHASEARKVARSLREHSALLEVMAARNEPPEPDGYDNEGERSSSPTAVFDISMLFAEL
jgi:Novel STAND NTPase 3